MPWSIEAKGIENKKYLEERRNLAKNLIVGSKVTGVAKRMEQ